MTYDQYKQFSTAKKAVGKIADIEDDFLTWAQDAVTEAENNLAFDEPTMSKAAVKKTIASMFRDYLHDKGLTTAQMRPLIQKGLQFIEWVPSNQFVRPGFATGTPYEGRPLGAARTLAGGKPENWTNPQEGSIGMSPNEQALWMGGLAGATSLGAVGAGKVGKYIGEKTNKIIEALGRRLK